MSHAAAWVFANNSPSTIAALMEFAPNTYARLVEHLLRAAMTASQG